MHPLAFICLLFCIAGVACRLKIVSPNELKSKFTSDSGIPFQLAKYGNIPYGSNLVGTLMLADPEDACTSLSANIGSDVQNPIFVVRRGGCKYTVKTRYAQLAGAKMVIVIDDSDEISSPPRGFDADGISIPTILIGKSDGDNIVDALLVAANSDKKSANAYVVVSMTFPYSSLSDKVSIDFWFSTSDSTHVVYKFLKEFKDFYLQSKDSFTFHPRYVTWHCKTCKHEGYKRPSPDCLSGGRYCAPDPDAVGALTGGDVVYEDLRQICLWKNFEDFWWNYIEVFSSNCVNKPDQPACAEKVLSDIGMSESQIATLHKCVDESFVKSPGQSYNPKDIHIDDNTLLADELLLQDEYDVSIFPSLFINHHVYQGEIKEGVIIFKAACESLTEPSELCLQYSSEGIVTKLDVGTIVLLVVIVLLIILIILFFYRRMVKREMSKEMNIQVSQMVSQYFALNEGKRLRESFDH